MAHHRITRMRLTAMTAIALAATPAAAQSTAQSETLAHLDVLYEQASPDSPARFRLIEERDRLAAYIEADGEALGVSVVGEHAQFRHVEDTTR